MNGPARAGALIYAHDVARLAAFYADLLGMRPLRSTPALVVLASPDFQLVVNALPPEVAAIAAPASPPVPRDNVAIKLFFAVDSLDDAQQRAESLGGALFGDTYAGPGFHARNGYDPEGNIFHLRQFDA